MSPLPYRKRGVAIAVTLAFVAVFTQASVAKPVTVTLGMLPVVDNLPFYVAEREGLFKAEGVDVRLLPFASAMERDTAMRSGAVDGCLGDVVMAALLESTGCDISIVSIGLGDKAPEGRFAVLAAPGSGITSLGDPRLKEIGISGNTITEFVADRLLASAGTKPGDVRKLDVPKLPVRMEMLLSGRLKAAVLPDPMATYAVSRGARLVADDTSENTTQTVIAFRAGSLREKGPAVRALLSAYASGAGKINSNPERYRGLLSDTAGMPEDIRGTYRIDHYPWPRLPEPGEIGMVTGWMLSKRLLKSPLAYGELVDGGFLPKRGKRP